MRFTYDADVDAAYLTLVDRDIRPGEAAQQSDIIATPGGAGSVILDFNVDGRLLGIEVLSARAVLPAELLPPHPD